MTPLTDEQSKLAGDNIRLAKHAANKIAARHDIINAEDMISPCMEGLCLAAQNFRADGGAGFPTYAWVWMRRICWNEIRRINRVRGMETYDSGLHPAPGAGPPEAAAAAEEAADNTRRVRLALDAMPPVAREAVLGFMDGVPDAATARARGTSRVAVNQARLRGFAVAREILGAA